MRRYRPVLGVLQFRFFQVAIDKTLHICLGQPVLFTLRDIPTRRLYSNGEILVVQKNLRTETLIPKSSDYDF